MSTEAVTWAMDHAPMLRTEKGKPDTTARHVLQALAEHASPTGTDAHPSVLRIQYRTGFDRVTVQRALRRLEKGGLIERHSSPLHQKVQVARATEEGRAVMRKADEAALRVEGALAEAYTPEERAAFEGYLERAIRTLDGLG